MCFVYRDCFEHMIFLPMWNISGFIDSQLPFLCSGKALHFSSHRPHNSSPIFHLFFPPPFFSFISLSPISSISHSFTLFYWCICSELTVCWIYRTLRLQMSKRQLLVSYQPWSLLSADCIIAFEYLEITSLHKTQPA